jgi:hypothetical protein
LRKKKIEKEKEQETIRLRKKKIEKEKERERK